MSHIVNIMSIDKAQLRTKLLHEAEDDAVKWLESTATTAFAIMK